MRLPAEGFYKDEESLFLSKLMMYPTIARNSRPIKIDTSRTFLI